MRRRDLIALAGTAAVLPLAAHAQRKPMPVIGVLMGATPSAEAPKLGILRDALKRLSYIEGQTVVIEPRYAEGRLDRLTAMAREMVALNPAVIVCVGSQETVALQAVTRAIPIVFMQVPNPIEMGLVTSLGRPGGNTTGFTQMTVELEGKRLELLHEIAPSVSRAVYLMDPALTPPPVVAERFAAAEAAAKSLGVALRRFDVTTPGALTDALAALDAPDTAVLVQNDPLLTGAEGARIVAFALAHRMPTVFASQPNVARGGLLSYGPDLGENYRLTASYVAKILKGASPGDLPVQRPSKFELVINLKTAKALGLAVPPMLLDRADEVIE